MEKKQIKKWWMLTTAKEMVIEVSDDYYNHGQLFETSKPFWGTQDELVQHIRNRWFTKDEVKILRKGWQAYQKIALVTGQGKILHWRWRGTFKEQQREDSTVSWRYALKGYDIHTDWYRQQGIERLSDEELKTAPRLKHRVLVDVDKAEICLGFEEKHSTSWRDAPWTKILRVTCLDHNGRINRDMARRVVAKTAEFIAELQNTIN